LISYVGLINPALFGGCLSPDESNRLLFRTSTSFASINSVVIATSDEPENSLGDGDTFNDIVIGAGCKSVQLRAERVGSGNGRVYTITFKVTDSSGNSTTATAKVTVPQSQNGSPAIDDGPHYTVNGCS